jgi:hypothetical protein
MPQNSQPAGLSGTECYSLQLQGPASQAARQCLLLACLTGSAMPAFRRFSSVHRVNLEGQQRVDLTRSPHRLAMTAICAFRPKSRSQRRVECSPSLAQYPLFAHCHRRVPHLARLKSPTAGLPAGYEAFDGGLPRLGFAGFARPAVPIPQDVVQRGSWPPLQAGCAGALPVSPGAHEGGVRSAACSLYSACGAGNSACGGYSFCGAAKSARFPRSVAREDARMDAGQRRRQSSAG